MQPHMILFLVSLLWTPFSCHALSVFRLSRLPMSVSASLPALNLSSSPTPSSPQSSSETSSSHSSTTTTPANYKERQVELDSGVSMKVTYAKPAFSQRTIQSRPVLLLLHGSFHGGWCWTEHYFDHFLAQGYTVVAPCWRGTGGTFAGEGVTKVKIQEHVEDLESLLDQLPTLLRRNDPVRPVVVAHSFGSLAVMKLLEHDPDRWCPRFAGIAMLCGVPPSGNGKMTMRYVRRSLKDSYKITVGFAMKKCLNNDALCRDLFFGGPKTTLPDGTVNDHGVSDEDVARYQQYFARDTEATIDLMDLAKQLPSFTTVDEGRASFYEQLPPCLVLGANQDFIVDRQGVEETARYFNVEEPVFVESPHDVMLTNQWKNAAHELDQWLSDISS